MSQKTLWYILAVILGFLVLGPVGSIIGIVMVAMLFNAKTAKR